MRYLDMLYTNSPDEGPHERECDYGEELDPVAAIIAAPWEGDAAECLGNAYIVREESGRILATGYHVPGPDAEHPDLIVACGRETRVYRYEATENAYEARLVAVAKLPEGISA